MPKKYIFLLLFILSLSLFSCSEGASPVPPHSAERLGSIDIYLIAGQSNASGYTYIDKETLSSLWPDAFVGTKNVLYSGKASSLSEEGIFWTPARAGLGVSPSGVTMGPEVGMAKTLSSYYNEKSGKVAGIIKYAHGGSRLLDKDFSAKTWTPPSYVAKTGYATAYTGRLYDELLREVEKNVADLKKMGYKSIRIKGVFWMQGESDRQSPDEYASALTLFISDLRKDLGKITGEDLSSLPFIIGEISETCFGADAQNRALNSAFIQMQRTLSEEIDGAYTVPTSLLEICKWDEALGKSTVDPVQLDTVHWNTESMFAVGTLVGECILENILGQ